MTTHPIPIGTPVRFKPANGSRPWQGVLTSYLSDTQVQCDNSGSIPLVMLEPLPDEVAQLRAEIAALQEVIAMQCELLG